MDAKGKDGMSVVKASCKDNLCVYRFFGVILFCSHFISVSEGNLPSSTSLYICTYYLYIFVLYI